MYVLCTRRAFRYRLSYRHLPSFSFLPLGSQSPIFLSSFLPFTSSSVYIPAGPVFFLFAALFPFTPQRGKRQRETNFTYIHKSIVSYIRCITKRGSLLTDITYTYIDLYISPHLSIHTVHDGGVAFSLIDLVTGLLAYLLVLLLLLVIMTLE